MRFAVAYSVSLVVFLALEICRITASVSSPGILRTTSLRLDRPSLPPTVVFHLFYIAGLVFFAVAPTLRTGQWLMAPVRGGLFGAAAFTSYAVVELAILRGWTGDIGLRTIGWSTIASAITATAAYGVTAWTVG